MRGEEFGRRECGEQITVAEVWVGVKSSLEKAGKTVRKWREGVEVGEQRTAEGKLLRV